MVLKALEFSDCISDSPWFRQNLREHELALDEAYKNIKNIENQARELISCTKKLSQAQRAFAKSLVDFKIETVGLNQTDDERVVASCLNEFANLVVRIEDERNKIISAADGSYLEPLRRFRTDAIGKTINEEKKKYKEASSKFHSNLEKHLHLSTVRKNDFKEADAQLDIQQRDFYRASLQYVAEIQSVQEKMKFEFVDIIASFLYSWLGFYNEGQVMYEDFKPFLNSVTEKVQKTRENFKCTQDEAEVLKDKILQTHTKAGTASTSDSLRSVNSTIKQGYVYMQEKSKLPKKIGRDVLMGSWTKYYCVYSKETRIFTMIPEKSDMPRAIDQSIRFKLKECVRRSSDSIDRRFCFDVVGEERGLPQTYTLQALSEEDRKQWLDALDGKQPIYSPGAGPSCSIIPSQLDKRGFDFVERCIATIERKGIGEQGLYRNCGVTSKVQKLIQNGLEQVKNGGESVNWDDNEWEVKTLSSALKTFLRNLPEPLMTFDLHNIFINAAKMDDHKMRIDHIHFYVHQLPESHRRMLEIVIRHLRKVADRKESNLMTVGNLGVCFGPTLLRPKEETMAAIMDIKFCNVVVEVLIANGKQIFDTHPPASIGLPAKPDHHATRLPIEKKETASTMEGQNSGNEAVQPASHIYDAPANYLGPKSQYVDRSRKSSIVRNQHQVGGDEQEVLSRKRAESNKSKLSFNGARKMTFKKAFAKVVQHLTDGRGGDSCDSLDSAQSGGSGEGEQNHQRGKVTTYATPYNPEAFATRRRQASLFTVSLPFQHYNRRVKTLYACTPDHDSELSFQAGQIITNVTESKEEGWLIGTLNGRVGLLPSNYCIFLD
ncbi:unnamed protein product, partial [Mesorhabditis belari]|uniref:Rho GTPase-activating protein 26 n=1 Tax=Mesorhabditis belari TaxID=2138241 RepID=A0AAF3E9B0_9BILA